MSTFTPLERAALNAIVRETPEFRTALERQISSAKVQSRENTGGGFFVDLEVHLDIEGVIGDKGPFGKSVYIGVEGLEYGLGAILFVKDGRLSLLEGYAVGAEDTSSVDFTDVEFAIIEEPGPLTLNGG
ncbi:hypothetical protein EAH87_06925 [Sphingomonas koreensis]|nr:hypothetical protein EAH87_06925 [Sphingomonas koreensis]